MEWSREFQDVLRRNNIIHRVKEPRDANLMGKLDATQQRLRALLRVKLDGSGEPLWSRRLPGVVDNYNNRLGHEGSFGSTPAEAFGETPQEGTKTNLVISKPCARWPVACSTTPS